MQMCICGKLALLNTLAVKKTLQQNKMTVEDCSYSAFKIILYFVENLEGNQFTTIQRL